MVLAVLYLIEILHQTTTCASVAYGPVCCILSKFYIKPQHSFDWFFFFRCCILSKFYIKPQQFRRLSSFSFRCILSKFYIKPQHFDFEKRINYVVSYRNSTSNHNNPKYLPNRKKLYLIEILHQTTTWRKNIITFVRLYLIEILHQTTTRTSAVKLQVLLYLIEILHQTTT